MSEHTQEIPLPVEEIFDPRPVVMKITSLGTTALYAAMKNDDFPQPYRVGPRRVVWKRAEVLRWLESRPRGTRNIRQEA